MNVIELVFYIAIVGFLCWLILQTPMPAVFRNLIVGIVVFALISMVLQSFGLLHGFAPLRLR